MMKSDQLYEDLWLIDKQLGILPPDLQRLLDPVQIVHVHLLKSDGRVVLFKRHDHYWMPASGEVEKGETYVVAACRELWEETGLVIGPDRVMISDHTFTGISPNGKSISGITCFAVLPEDFNESFRFNGELIDYEVLSPQEALGLLEVKGMDEAFEGLSFLIGD